MVPDETAHLSHNCLPLGTRGRFTFNIYIASYIITPFFLFFLFYTTGITIGKGLMGEPPNPPLEDTTDMAGPCGHHHFLAMVSTFYSFLPVHGDLMQT